MKYLALCHDGQDLIDILNSQLAFKDIILILNKKNISPKLNGFSPRYFCEVASIRNYVNSGDVELMACELYQKYSFQRIIATNELDILRAARLRAHFQLPGQSTASAEVFCDKIRMKEILKANGIEVPTFQRVGSPMDIIEFVKENGLPVVLKPFQGTGSEGVQILKSMEDVYRFLKNTAYFSINTLLNLQIESFVAGTMYHINGLVLNGNVAVSWPSVYPHQSIRMIEGAYASSYLLSEANPLVKRLNTYAQKVLKALPTPENTAFYLEVFINDNDDIIFCEIASRIGGKGVRQSWSTSLNIDMGKIFVNAQVAPPIPNQRINSPLKPSCLTGEIWFPKQPGILKHIESHCPFPWVKDYQTFAQKGETVKSFKNISGCLAGIPLLVAKTESEMQKRLDEVALWFNKSTRWYSS